jgi:hypothetical protein
MYCYEGITLSYNTVKNKENNAEIYYSVLYEQYKYNTYPECGGSCAQ